jgi:hypothetical protein
MAKVKKVNEDPVQYWFFCPGCEHYHIFDNRWLFNNDYDKPTLGPQPGKSHSYLTWWPENGVEKRCHSYITDGKIHFLTDCTHKLAGQLVNLPELEKEDAS